ncbi:MAG: RNA polymerase sigma factor [Candidatus Aminicenantes bacterium]|nr:RNA polymerase sigma factor [Candidatus Aminicenantes bacterium]
MGIAVSTSGNVVSVQMTDEKSLYDWLIAPVESRMMRTIWRVVRHDQLAEDTLQDALAIIWRKRNRIHRHPNPQALILKICLNCAYDSLRKRARQRRQKDLSNLASYESQSRTNASLELEKKQAVAEVLNAISRLPRSQALAVLMRIVQNQPYEAIAQTMGCSETTVRIHVSRGRKRLRQWLSHLQTSSFKESSNG